MPARRLIPCLIALVLVGCDSGGPTTGQGGPATTAPPIPAVAPAAAIPDDLKYTVSEGPTSPGIKRTVNVRLSRRATEAELRSLAVRLRNSDPGTYQRTFILYHLPGMMGDRMAWATTHFDPDLEVDILGLSAEDVAKLEQAPPDPSLRVIGSWYADGSGMARRLTIGVKDGAIYLERAYPDGSRGEDRLIERPSDGGRRFELAEGNPAGEFLEVDPGGNLACHAGGRAIWTAAPIEWNNVPAGDSEAPAPAGPDPSTLLRMGRAIERANPAAAAGYYRQLIESHPDSPEAGEARERLGAIRPE